MNDFSAMFHEHLEAALASTKALTALESPMRRAAEMIRHCLDAGGKLLICGNGGSAADAGHFATELVIRFAKERPAYPALCLNSDGGALTAAGNDYGFEEIFARQVAAFGKKEDVFVCLTTSGKSKNIERALEEARKRGLRSIAFLGRDGGTVKDKADIELLVKSDSTARIQEAHQLLIHILCQTLEP